MSCRYTIWVTLIRYTLCELGQEGNRVLQEQTETLQLRIRRLTEDLKGSLSPLSVLCWQDRAEADDMCNTWHDGTCAQISHGSCTRSANLSDLVRTSIGRARPLEENPPTAWMQRCERTDTQWSIVGDAALQHAAYLYTYITYVRHTYIHR